MPTSLVIVNGVSVEMHDLADVYGERIETLWREHRGPAALPAIRAMFVEADEPMTNRQVADVVRSARYRRDVPHPDYCSPREFDRWLTGDANWQVFRR